VSYSWPDGKNPKSAEAVCNKCIKEGKQARLYTVILTVLRLAQDAHDEAAALRREVRALRREMRGIE